MYAGWRFFKCRQTITKNRISEFHKNVLVNRRICPDLQPSYYVRIVINVINIFCREFMPWKITIPSFRFAYVCVCLPRVYRGQSCSHAATQDGPVKSKKLLLPSRVSRKFPAPRAAELAKKPKSNSTSRPEPGNKARNSTEPLDSFTLILWGAAPGQSRCFLGHFSPF